MARKKKSSKDTETDIDQKSADSDESVATDLTDAETDTATSKETVEEEAVEASAEELSETTETSETESPSDDPAAPDVTEQSDAETASDTLAIDEETVEAETVDQTDVPDHPPIAPPEPVIIRKGGFVPMVLGGIVAAVIGFGASQLLMPQSGVDAVVLTEFERKLATQATTITELTERIEVAETAGSGGDLGDIESTLSDNLAAISGLADRLFAVESQLTDIASQPVDDGDQGAALVAYERQLKELQAAVSAMSDNAQQMEENAQVAAKATLQRAALTRIQTALDAGVGFETALADLENLGADIPSPLKQSAASGVASLSDLQAGFPDAARSALAVSRAETEVEDQGGLTSFLRSQLGARSLQPREGNDPDAILSRAEAAARQGRLNDALAEIELLPEAGRAELSDWSGQAARRLDAVAAAQELGEKLN
ncbi:COG4223 family protein [Roseovarius aestuarii]|uniref:Mitochondrial inner membrane protein n=1 Tax=Roseovarius aestuarii TaxID=475083 RepID=A0A1X7BR06_9RHOB|nr:hypothetical protein [Roseovarius aestuarii]SMC12062.1 hypothetical protein ROA7745_01885 [Roseovarius aestuarii]